MTIQGRPVNALTVDVEDYFHVSAFNGVISKEDWGRLPSRVERNTERLLELFDSYSVRATFFVLGWVAERFPELVRKIAAQGHEIGCHGYSHSLIYQQEPQGFRQETERARACLQDESQQAVNGYRAASWSITVSSIWALDILADLGFRYDSSIFPIRRDLYGIPGAERFLHTRTTTQGELVELPPATVQWGGKTVPVAGGGYFRLYPYVFTKAALRRINAHERKPFVFYIHPWEIDPGQPRLKAGIKSRMRHYLNLKRCESRLHRLLKDFRFSCAESVVEQQLAEEKRTQRSECGSQWPNSGNVVGGAGSRNRAVASKRG